MRMNLTGLKILVVEDEFLVASLIQDLLEDAGCVVSGPIPRLSEAIDAARADDCDAAVLDVNLGGYRVFPVAEELSRRHIPFVIVTGYATTTLPEPFDRSPTIRKPFRNQDLLNAISNLVDCTA
ncbi:MAG: response regulator [Alphaproteobacteria bacterium]|nr:response regulator [Alphaproteobacteria bacterium]